MSCLVVGVVNAPLVEYVGLVVDQRLVEVFAIRSVVASTLFGLLLHTGDGPSGHAQETGRVQGRVVCQSRHLVADHVGTPELPEIGSLRKGPGFKCEDPERGRIL